MHFLEDDGVFVSESHYLLDLVSKREFDTVYHEHLCYYSVKPLMHFFKRFDMEICDVKRVSSHGGSIRVYARAISSELKSDSVEELLKLEAKEAHVVRNGYSLWR